MFFQPGLKIWLSMIKYGSIIDMFQKKKILYVLFDKTELMLLRLVKRVRLEFILKCLLTEF